MLSEFEWDTDGLVLDRSDFIANTLELLQFCTMPSISFRQIVLLDMHI